MLALRLAGGAGNDERLAVCGESRLRDPLTGIDGMHEAAVCGGEKRGVPCALRLAAGHHKMRALRMPRHGFHKPGAVLAVFDLIDALWRRRLPVPALPCHLAIAGHGIA